MFVIDTKERSYHDTHDLRSMNNVDETTTPIVTKAHRTKYQLSSTSNSGQRKGNQSLNALCIEDELYSIKIISAKQRQEA